MQDFGCWKKSGGGPPHSKTLARQPTAPGLREASWSAPVLWRFAPRTNDRQHRLN